MNASAFMQSLRTRYAISFRHRHPLWALVAGRNSNRKRAYREFVELDLAGRDAEWAKEMKRSGLAVGSGAFLEKMKGWHRKRLHLRSAGTLVRMRTSV